MACVRSGEPDKGFLHEIICVGPRPSSSEKPFQSRAVIAVQLHKKNGWQAVWSPTTRRTLQQAIARRSAHGLDHVAFLEQPDDRQSPAAREAALTHAALRYSQALAVGLVDPAQLHPVYTLARPKLDLSAALSRALAHGTLGQWLASLAPQDGDYTLLSSAYLSLREQALSPGLPTLGSSDIIRPGDTGSRIPAIRQ